MNWDDAEKWAEEANKEKQIRELEPHWSWDCGLKLDFDGGLLRVSSRFYQQHENIFDGSVSFCIEDNEIFKREFSSRHIENIKKDVEVYVLKVKENIEKLLKNNMEVFVVTEKEG